jgi:hypothetical protein
VREWVGGYPVELCVVVATPPHHGKAVRRGEERTPLRNPCRVAEPKNK